MICTWCNGSAVVVCKACNGSGLHKYEEECLICIYNVRDGIIGDVECQCEGTGTETCDMCEGMGEFDYEESMRYG